MNTLFLQFAVAMLALFAAAAEAERKPNTVFILPDDVQKLVAEGATPASSQ